MRTKVAKELGQKINQEKEKFEMNVIESSFFLDWRTKNRFSFTFSRGKDIDLVKKGNK